MHSNGKHQTVVSRDALLEQIAGLLNGRKRQNGFQCHCPSHDDAKPSLSLDVGSDDRILLYCHAGCEFETIANELERLGIPKTELAPAPQRPNSPNGRKVKKPVIAATYDYRNESGETAFQTVRLKPKGFFQRRPDGHGGWINNLKEIETIPYRLPELISAVQQGKPVYIVEGEKDADRLASLGLVATCNHGGAGKWSAKHSSYFKGASQIIILPDNDEAGQRHATSVAHSLHHSGIKDICVIDLPDLPEKGDISDWLDNNHTLQELEGQVRQAETWSPPSPNDSQIGSTRWRLLSAKEVLNLSPITWLIEGEIPENGLTVLYGDSGSGKSFLALDYALRIAQESNVVYIAGEGLAGYPDRLLAWRNHHNQPLDNFHLVDEAIPMLDETAVTEFISLINTLQPKLIVIDTLARAMLGGDENSARDMGMFIAACNDIQRHTGAAVLVVHHTGKNRNSERGSSALRGGADSMIELSNDDGLISISCAKSKDSQPFKTRYMRLVKVATRDGRDSCVLLPSEKVLMTNQLTDSQQRALDVLSWETFVTAGCSARILAEQAKIPSGSIYRVLNTLMKLGHVTQAKRGEPYFITEEGKSALEQATS